MQSVFDYDLASCTKSPSYHRLRAAGAQAAIHAGLRHVAPAKTASAPGSSSMRISWLYLALRSDRQGAPVLIWPQQRPTAMSAIVVSSVSPERCEHMMPQPFCLHNFTASMDSERLPIWLTFKRRALQAFFSMAVLMRDTFVTVRSSPTICIPSPWAADMS